MTTIQVGRLAAAAAVTPTASPVRPSAVSGPAMRSVAMVLAIVTMAVAAIVIAKSEVERNRWTDIGRIGVARIIVGIISRGIGRPIHGTSAKAAGNQQTGRKTLHCMHTWSVHLSSPNANLVSF